MSVRNLNAVAIVDRVSGDIVWVLTDSTRGQHTTHMLPDDMPGGGNILLFDNGWTGNWSLVPNRYHSRVVEIDPVTMSFPYVYTAESSGYPKETFFANIMSGAQRHSNGNTLIAASKWGRIFEVTDSGELVWEYLNPFYGNNNRVYRAYKVPLDWAAPHFVPDLVVSGSTDPDRAQVGSDLTFTIEVENLGPDAGIDIELVQATPVGTTFQSVSAPSGWQCTTPAVGGTGLITCNSSSSLVAGAAEFLTTVVNVPLCGIDGTIISSPVTATSLGTDANPGDNATTIDTIGASDSVIQDLVVSLINDGEDVQLDWGDWTPQCGYRVVRSTAPDGGWVEISGSISDITHTDTGAGSSNESYYYLVRVD
jgi:uncharacterized repeat protein (TIGR01451 family)